MRSRPQVEGLERRYLLSWTISGQVQIYEPGVDGPLYGPSPGSLVYVDLNRDGTHDPDEPSAVSDANGNFSVTGRGSGTFRIREQPPADGTHYKSDESGFRDLSLSDGQTVSGIVFANSQESTISGVVFEDGNGNGVQDPGEPGLGGWGVNQQNVDLPDAVTGADGHYALPVIGAGQWFLYLQAVSSNPFGTGAGWVLTTPLGHYRVTTSGRDIGNVDFGVKPTPAPGTPAPDLQADAITASVPSTVYGGELVSGSVALSNQGNAIALGPMQISFYAAADPRFLQFGDAVLGTVPVSVDLAPGAQSQVSFTLTLPHNLPSGTFHFTALLNSTFTIPESSADNDRVVGSTFAVAPSGADLSASFASAVPLVVAAGQHAQVGLTIGNVGGADFSGNVTVRLYASSDASLDSSDRLLATMNAGRLSIARAGSTPVSVGFTGPSDLNGYYFLIAQVSSPSEPASADKSNNTAVSSTGVLFGSLSTTGTNPPPAVGSGQQSGDVALGPLEATFKSMPSGPPRTVTDLLLMNPTGGTVRRRVRVTLYAVPTDGGVALPVRVLTRQLRLRAGASQRLRLSFRFSRHMPAGTYTLRAELQDIVGKSVGPVTATVDETETFTVPARR